MSLSHFILLKGTWQKLDHYHFTKLENKLNISLRETYKETPLGKFKGEYPRGIYIYIYRIYTWRTFYIETPPGKFKGEYPKGIYRIYTWRKFYIETPPRKFKGEYPKEIHRIYTWRKISSKYLQENCNIMPHSSR